MPRQPGRYTLRVNRVEFAQFVTPAFDLAEGEQKRLPDIRMKAGVILQGSVKNDAGAPVEKATVSLKDLQGRPIQMFSMATSGSDGKYAMHGVEPGSYIAHVQAKGHAPAQLPVEISEAGGMKNAVLTRGGSVRVTVVDPGGDPVAGVDIKLYDSRGAQVTRTISLVNFDSGRRFTDGAGRTELDDLAGGTYEVRAKLEGWTLVGGPGRARVEPGGQASVQLVLEKAP